MHFLYYLSRMNQFIKLPSESCEARLAQVQSDEVVSDHVPDPYHDAEAYNREEEKREGYGEADSDHVNGYCE